MKIENAEQHKQVKSLFIRLKNLPNSDQKQFLDRHCQDQRIRASVENLLFHYPKVNDYWPESEPETETGSEFANRIGEMEPFLMAFPKLKLSSPTESIHHDFEGTSRFIIQKRLGVVKKQVPILKKSAIQPKRAKSKGL